MDPVKDSRLRLAASSYSNTAPLIWSFVHGPRQGEVDLLTDTAPARCADMLAQGLVDGALVPAIEYQHLENVLAVPGLCVGSRRMVRSVVLATCLSDLKQVRSVALDTSSRTSVALIKIIFCEFIGVEPEWISHRPDLPAMLAAADAALLIGDPAMTFARSGLQVHDLAGLWREFTGRAFVFAFWMARAGAAERVAAVDFAAARDEGLAQLDQIATFYARTTGLPSAELVEYLTSNISFVLDDEMLAGLSLYYELAHKHGLIPNVRELNFVKR